MKGRVLIVAGSDSGGGAGVQADVKTVTALCGYAAAAVATVTAQNTKSVLGMVDIPPAFVARQMEAVLSDIGADCIKTGMLHTAAIIEAVAGVIRRQARGIPLVVDPVMDATNGESLLDHAALDVLKRDLALHATVLTPNLPEAERLIGVTIRDVEDMKRAATALHTLGAGAVLLKGGHLHGRVLSDVLVVNGDIEVFEGERVETANTHGTGCTLASGIATGLAQGMTVRKAVIRARAYLREAILTAPGLGQGRGPLNHAHTVRPFDDAV